MYTQSDYPYKSCRRAVYGMKGMVATTQPLAAQAGLDMLKKGGNAIDAAIAAASCLTVVEPASNGIGGDAFAIVWYKNKLYGLNASGCAPKALSIDRVKSLGYEKMPKQGLLPITIPGVPAAWASLSQRFGSLSMKENLAPAIAYAKDGYPVSPAICKFWQSFIEGAKEKLQGKIHQGWFDTFSFTDKLKPGDICRFPDHAKTLQSIADTNARSFYRGEIAKEIDSFMKENGGFLSGEDLASYTPEWVEPISTNYRGYDIWEIPPNGQGLVALEALNILSNFSFQDKNNPETYHSQMEAMKIAFEDGIANITDPRYMKIPPTAFLSGEYGKKKAHEISKVARQTEVEPLGGGTVYLAAADEEGNMISYIQSNFDDFGSGIVVPGTGINLQNRGSSFMLDETHSNALVPGKKTYHTIIPGFITKEDKAIGPFGVMGAYMQPQGHVQVAMNMIDFGLNPQAALDAPRWQWIKKMNFKVEPGIPEETVDALKAKGHDIVVDSNTYAFGRGQIICRNPETGVLTGGTDSRSDGVVAAW